MHPGCRSPLGIRVVVKPLWCEHESCALAVWKRERHIVSTASSYAEDKGSAIGGVIRHIESISGRYWVTGFVDDSVHVIDGVSPIVAEVPLNGVERIVRPD